MDPRFNLKGVGLEFLLIDPKVVPPYKRKTFIRLLSFLKEAREKEDIKGWT